MKPKAKLNEFTFRHARRLMAFSRREPARALASLKSSANGLSAEEAAARLEEFGPNSALEAEESAAWQILSKAVRNPFNFLIATLSIVSYLTDDLRAAIVMASMIVLSVGFTFFQELRSSRAAERLSAMVCNFATVLRPGGPGIKFEVPVSELVPGDVIQLSAGDMIPADVRLLTSKHLTISQAALTGESVPVEKDVSPETHELTQLPDLKSIFLQGTSVASGIATAVVIHTGRETYFGSIAKSITAKKTETDFDQGVRRFTNLMLQFMFVMVPAVFFINGFTKGNWSDAFLFAIAIAVGLTPEMLPMIVTVNLAKGALAMSKRKVIVKRLGAIQNFGAMDILCTDKTGTLTEDQLVYGGSFDALGKPETAVLRYAYLNSFFQSGLKNFLDAALIRQVSSLPSEEVGAENFHVLDELPFDFERKRMSVLVEGPDSFPELICKGAVEELISVCRGVSLKGGTGRLNQENRKQCLAAAAGLHDEGYRVIAVAVKEIPYSSCAIEDESGLTLVGFVGFLDPPVKESAMEAVRGLANHGVSVKILTGDNERVTAKVAKAVGLPSVRTLLGSEIDTMNDMELAVAARDTTIFAKLTPDQKQRIVKSIRQDGHVVGFMGDGINDAPALRAADVGISVNNAVDIAKETADIILLEKSLLTLEQGVIEGRKVFGNIIKYIKMGASSNFGNVFSMLGASCFLPFLPMLPVQMLTQNLFYDFSQTGIPLDRVDESYLRTPRRWEIGDIRKFMFFLGPVSSLFDYATFALMWFYFHANSPATQSLFQSGWFVEGLFSQTLIVHVIRTKQIPFIQSRASLALSITTITVMLACVLLPFTGLGASLGFVPLPVTYFVWLFGFLLGYCVLANAMKTWFIRRYGYN
jgi:Mg2+-importing ATPase